MTVKFRDVPQGANFKWKKRWWKKLKHGGDTVQGPGMGGAQDQKGDIRVIGNEALVSFVQQGAMVK